MVETRIYVPATIYPMEEPVPVMTEDGAWVGIIDGNSDAAMLVAEAALEDRGSSCEAVVIEVIGR